MKVPDLYVGKQLFVGTGAPTALGIGPVAARGSAYIEGPTITGTATFPNVWASSMIGPLTNPESPTPVIPGSLCMGISNPYSLAVVGPAAFMGNVDTNMSVNVGLHVIAQGEVVSRCGLHILSRKKNFDIPHPTRDGYRLRHTCPEGPSNDVYCRGKVVNKKEILLPTYWKGLVDSESITVQLTPIGVYQELSYEITDWGTRIKVLNNQGGAVNCSYVVFGERKDVDKIVVEYEGKIEDYPGRDQRSIVGYHYDYRQGVNG